MRNVAAVCCHVTPDRAAYGKVFCSLCSDRYIAVVRVCQVCCILWVIPVVRSGIWSRDVVVYYLGTTGIGISWVLGIVTVDETASARAVKQINDSHGAAKNKKLWNGNQFDAPCNLRRCNRREIKIMSVTVAITSLKMIVLKIDLAQESVAHTAVGGVRHEIRAAGKNLVGQTDTG